MLVGPPIQSVRGMNDAAFDQKLYWNSPELRTTAEYQVIKTPSPGGRGERGRIIDDLLELDVFPDKDVQLSTMEMGSSSLLNIEFPDDLKPGEKAQVRLLLHIENLFRLKDPDAPRAEYICDLKYFNARSHPASEAVQILGGDASWIPVLARPASPKDGTGFTIVLYAMPGFTKGDGFGLVSSQAFDQYTPDGTQSENRVKLLWQLDELLERDGADPNQPVSCNSFVRISGSLIESDDGKRIRDLQQTVKAAKTEVRWATVIAIAGTLIAVAAFIYDLVK